MKKNLKIVMIIFCSFMLSKYAMAQCSNYTNLVPTTPMNNISNGMFLIDNHITINKHIVITDAEIAIMPYATITVVSGGELEIRGTHLFSCGSDMWGGIKVIDDGTLIIKEGIIHDNSLIEDAETAINFQTKFNYLNAGVTPLEIENTVFNRNKVGIFFDEPYNWRFNEVVTPIIGNFPIVLKNSIFTCRDIPFPMNNSWFRFNNFKHTSKSLPYTWPMQPEGYSAPYINTTIYSATNSNAYLKGTGTPNKKSEAAILFANNAYVTRGTYFQFGDQYPNSNGSNNALIFDNQTVGIKFIATHLKLENCTFQNTVGANTEYTYGVLANNWDEADGDLQFKGDWQNGQRNMFFDCGTGIQVNYIPRVKIEQCVIRSSKQTSLSNVNEGLEGIVVNASDFGLYTFGARYYNNIIVSRNDCNNIAYGIRINYNDFPWFVASGITTSPTTNNLLTPIEVDDNKVTIEAGTYNLPGTGNPGSIVLPSYFTKQAIELNVVYPSIPSANASLPRLRCTRNWIEGVLNGITLSGWNGKDLVINKNLVNLASDPILGTLQTSICLKGCQALNSRSNFVFANYLMLGQNGNFASKRGFVFSNSGNITANCNLSHSKTLKRQYQFSGNHQNVDFLNNRMIGSDLVNWGLVLDNGGVIGAQQAANGAASDNSFLDVASLGTNKTWSNASFKTYCISSDARQSPLTVRQGVNQYDPLTGGLNAAPGGVPYGAAGSLNNGANNNYDCSSSNPIWNFKKVVRNELEIDVPVYPGQGYLVLDDPKDFVNTSADHENKKIREAEQLATKTVSSTNTIAAQRLYVAQHNLYQLLQTQTNWRDASDILNSFYVAKSAKGFGKIDNILKLVYSNNSATAKTELNNWVTSNHVEDNYKTFFNQMIDVKVGHTWDNTILESIAQLCPQTDGNVVFYAQNLYNFVNNTHTDFVTSCDNDGVSLIEPIAKANVLQETSIKAYPNPFNNYITIEGSDIKQVIITNTLGQKVLHQNVSNTNMHNLEASSLSKGFYVVQITKTDGTVERIKMIK